MQLAKYFRKNKKSILCELCPHGCNISNGNIGYCLARKNIDGKLYAINYGKISSIALDPIKKKPLYHFFPGKKILSIGSYGCNMKCLFCQNFEISQHIPNTKFIEPKEILDIAMSIENNIGIAFTYNEPTISIEYILELAPLIKKNNLHNVMVSNGMINKKPLNDLLKYIDAFNIDLKAFTNKFYKKHGGDLKTVMRNIKTIWKAKKHIEITTLIIHGENDSEKEIINLAKWIAKISREIPLHLSRFFPTHKMKNNISTDIKHLHILATQAKKYLKNVYIGNI